jgi:uncharacterized OB-fold protein
MVEPVPPVAHSIAEFIQGYENARVLRGFRCRQCGSLTATWGLACSRCGSRELEEAVLAEEGRVVAGTLVVVPTEEFLNDAPYAYVLVDLDGGGRVSGWMPGVTSEEAIAPGTRVRFRPSYKTGIQFERSNPGD